MTLRILIHQHACQISAFTVKSFAEEHCAEEHQPGISMEDKNNSSLRFWRNKNIDFMIRKEKDQKFSRSELAFLTCSIRLGAGGGTSNCAPVLNSAFPLQEHEDCAIGTSPSFTSFAHYKNIASLGPPNWCSSAYDFTVLSNLLFINTYHIPLCLSTFPTNSQNGQKPEHMHSSFN